MPDSKAANIIICNGRIELAAARKGSGQVEAASRTAMNLVTYYGDRVTEADTLPISNLQHNMMEVLNGAHVFRGNQHPSTLDEMVDEMFALLDALEEKFS